MASIQSYLDVAKDEIARWESQKPGMIASVANFILKPAEAAAAKLVPEKMQTAVAAAVEGFLRGAGHAANRTFDADQILSTRGASLGDTRSLARKLKVSDELAASYWRRNVIYATGEGAATGAAGFPGLVADIPLLMALAMRQIQEIGTCYGYHPASPFESDYALQVLQAGSAVQPSVKLEFLVLLKQTEQTLIKVTWKKMNAELAAKAFGREAGLAALRQFAKSLGIQLTKRKALQMIPVVGALVGASFNGVFLNDVGRCAYMSYRRRYIAENEKPSRARKAHRTTPRVFSQ